MTALFKILMMMMMMIIIIIIKGKIGRVPKAKMEKQSNAWTVH